MIVILIILAGFFKAVADTLTHHYDTSIFKWKDRRFWDPALSYAYAPFLKFTKYRLDAWHLANSGCIICFCAALAIGTPYPWYIDFAGSGIVFNLSFNLFYDTILRK